MPRRRSSRGRGWRARRAIGAGCTMPAAGRPRRLPPWIEARRCECSRSRVCAYLARAHTPGRPLASARDVGERPVEHAAALGAHERMRDELLPAGVPIGMGPESVGDGLRQTADDVEQQIWAIKDDLREIGSQASAVVEQLALEAVEA